MRLDLYCKQSKKYFTYILCYTKVNKNRTYSIRMVAPFRKATNINVSVGFKPTSTQYSGTVEIYARYKDQQLKKHGQIVTVFLSISLSCSRD